MTTRFADQMERLEAGKPFLVNVNDYGGYSLPTAHGLLTFAGEPCKVLDSQDSYVVLKRVKASK